MWGAALFVLVRVMYRALFNGAGGATLLWEIPAVRLPAPLSTVTLFGPVSVEGLWGAVFSALPLAGILVVWGMVLAVVDFRRILRTLQRVGPGRATLHALGIMLATFPSIVSSVTSVRRSAALRGVRGIRGGALVVSAIVTRSIEMALATGAAMESRGYGHSTDRATGMCEFPVEARDLSLHHTGKLIIGDLNLSCAPGSVTVITGDTGSGKTTLLRALAGQFQHLDGGAQTGSLFVGAVDRLATPPRDTAHFVGFVPQDPRTAFIAEYVNDELTAAAELCGHDLDAAEYRARTIMTELGIAALWDRTTASLSAGEATLVAVAAALVIQPTVLILDEPLADLDTASRTSVLAALTRIAERTRIAVVVSEHRTESLHTLATTVVRLAGGAATVGGAELVAVAPDDVTPLPQNPSLVALCGPNGVGKTTLLARANDNERGSALVPERAADLLLTSSVQAECSLNDRVRQLERGTTLGILDALAPESINPALHPHDLSTGQQLLLALAIQVAHNPHHLLVDEPTRGLDAATRNRVAQVVRDQATHRRVTVATHDMQFVPHIGATVVSMPGRDSVTVADLHATGALG